MRHRQALAVRKNPRMSEPGSKETRAGEQVSEVPSTKLGQQRKHL